MGSRPFGCDAGTPCFDMPFVPFNLMPKSWEPCFLIKFQAAPDGSPRNFKLRTRGWICGRL